MTREELSRLMLMYGEMLSGGRRADAEALLTVLHGKFETPSHAPDPIPNGDDDEAEKKRAAAREYARKYRQRKKPSDPKSDESDASDLTNLTENLTQSTPENSGLVRAVESSSSLIPLRFSRFSEENENSQTQREKSSSAAQVVQIISVRSDESDASDLTDGTKAMALWQAWCRIAGVGVTRPTAATRRKLDEAWNALQPLARARGCHVGVVFAEAASRFRGDVGVRRKHLGLNVFVSQIADWAAAAPPSSGPVAATSVEDFDTSGDDFAHLNEVNHG